MKTYKIEDEEPTTLHEPAVAYGNTALAYDSDVLEPNDTEHVGWQTNVYGTNVWNDEWDDLAMQSIALSIEQIERGQCHSIRRITREQLEALQ